MGPSDRLAARLERALRVHAPNVAGSAPALQSALDAAAALSGRRVRGLLVLEAAVGHGLEAAAAERLACAVEYWHLASLLLDDLPCMDDADDRRGRPCVHRTHGEAPAILAALAWVNRAYALAHEAFADQPAAVRRAATTLIDAALGPAGIVGGQARDLAYASGPGSAREIGRIAWQKTGALIWLCVGLPALVSRPATAEQRALRRLGVYWGLAYQAIDDLRDVLGSGPDAGKTLQRDGPLGRPNLALALGVPAAHRRLARLLVQAERTLADMAEGDGRWRYLTAWHERVFVVRRSGLRAA